MEAGRIEACMVCASVVNNGIFLNSDNCHYSWWYSEYAGYMGKTAKNICWRGNNMRVFQIEQKIDVVFQGDGTFQEYAIELEAWSAFGLIMTTTHL
jgi:hypothetical protein